MFRWRHSLGLRGSILLCLLLAFLVSLASSDGGGTSHFDIDNAPAPLFDDPKFHGAADPTVIYVEATRTWVLLYTQRRAADLSAPNHTWCMGTEIGVATSENNGKRWKYQGVAKGLHFEPGYPQTFRSPTVVWHNDRTKDKHRNRDGKPKLYHLMVTYFKGNPKNKWDAQPAVAHYTAADPAGHWDFKGLVPELKHAMDPHLARLPSGKYKVWFKDIQRATRGSTGSAISSDGMQTWVRSQEPAARGPPHGAPTAFWWRGYWWLLVDARRVPGLLVFKSPDAKGAGEPGRDGWQRQTEPLLHWGGARNMDGNEGRHPHAVVDDDRAFVFYMVHPNRAAGGEDVVFHKETAADRNTLDFRMSVIQVAELSLEPDHGGRLTCKRDQSLAPRTRNKKRRAIAGASLRQAFAAEFEREAAAKRDATEAAQLFARKRKQDAEADLAAWKKQQWVNKQNAFTEMMAARKKGPKPGTLDFEIARYVGTTGKSPAAEKKPSSSGFKKRHGRANELLTVEEPKAAPAPQPPPPPVAEVEVAPPRQAKKKSKKAKALSARAEAMKAQLQAESL